MIYNYSQCHIYNCLFAQLSAQTETICPVKHTLHLPLLPHIYHGIVRPPVSITVHLYIQHTIIHVHTLSESGHPTELLVVQLVYNMQDQSSTAQDPTLLPTGYLSSATISHLWDEMNCIDNHITLSAHSIYSPIIEQQFFISLVLIPLRSLWSN